MRIAKQIKRLDHIQICIPFGKENEARNFYTNILGFKEIPKPTELLKNGGLWYEIGEIQFHIGCEKDVQVSKRHPAFEVECIAETKNFLLENNVKIKKDILIPNVLRFSMIDPFENRIEFLEKCKIEIKPINETTISYKTLTKLLHSSYQKLAEKGLRYLASHQNEEKTKERAEKGSCFVLLKNNELVGTITYYNSSQSDTNDYYKTNGVATYGQFCIKNEFKNLGLGKMLIEFVEQKAKEEKVKEIAIDTSEQAKELIEFYTKLNYSKVGQVDWKDTNYLSVILSKKLE